MRRFDTRRAFALAACAGVFLLLLCLVKASDAPLLDSVAYAGIVEGLRAPALTPAMLAISTLATAPVLVMVLLVIFAVAERRVAWFCTLNLAGSTLLNLILKELVQRPRPEGFRLAEEAGFSFPSGHAMAAMAFFGLLIWLVWRSDAGGRARIALSAVFAAIIILVGVSRIYLGVHFASDVVAGFCMSFAWLTLYTWLAAPRLLDEGR